MPELRKEYGVTSLGIFGSTATGKATESSDIDVLIEFDQPLGLKFMELAERLEQAVSRPVDILTPEGLRSIRQPEIAQSIKNSLRYV